MTGFIPNRITFCLDLSNSTFPNMYPIFHISELEPYYKRSTDPTETSTTNPTDFQSNKITKILSSRKYKGRYQYLVTKSNFTQDWIDADIIDKNKYYDSILAEYQKHVYDQFCATVNHPE